MIDYYLTLSRTQSRKNMLAMLRLYIKKRFTRHSICQIILFVFTILLVMGCSSKNSEAELTTPSKISQAADKSKQASSKDKTSLKSLDSGGTIKSKESGDGLEPLAELDQLDDLDGEGELTELEELDELDELDSEGDLAELDELDGESGGLDELDELDGGSTEIEQKESAEVWDPLEGYNRLMTGFNDFVFIWVLDPVARGYRFILPEVVREGIANFFTNLMYPVRLVNNLLQFKFRNAVDETARFVVNSTIGLAGLWDPAKDYGKVQAHDEDFGQTLGFYGVGPGPHLVLPFFGPRNLRDAVAMYPDSRYLDPQSYYWDTTEQRIGSYVVEVVNEASLNIGVYQNLKEGVMDYYTFFKVAYEEKRAKEIEE